MTDILWRVAAPELKAGRYRSIIQDTGQIHLAVAASSDGSYLFSEKGAGVQPLAFIGTLLQISQYLAQNEQRRIANRVADLPDIHAGLDRFVPQERFKEVFSIGTIATHVTRSLLDFFPTGSGWGETVADLLTNGLTFGQILKDLSASQALQDAVTDQDRRKTPLYILRVSYLPEDGLRKVGTREITFGQLLAAFGSVQR